MLTILGSEEEEVRGLCSMSNYNQLCVCNQCIQLCVSSVQWMMGTVVRGEVQQCSARVHVVSG